MTDWLSVLLLIVCGIILLVIELVFVPGTTVLGIVGFVMLIGGVYISFAKFGQVTGGWVLAGTALISILAVVYSLRSGTWKKLVLRSSMDSKVNENEKLALQVGLKGVAISDLRPIGTAEFLEKTYEVQTQGNYLVAGTPITISALSNNKIIVEPIS